VTAEGVFTPEQYADWVDWRNPFTGATRGTPRLPSPSEATVPGERRHAGARRGSPRFAEMVIHAPESLSDVTALLAEHGIIGREFPDVLANTTSGFGLGDWEWILAFEADQADRLVDCICRLRDARARVYTKEEVPFVTGIRRHVRAARADLA